MIQGKENADRGEQNSTADAITVHPRRDVFGESDFTAGTRTTVSASAPAYVFTVEFAGTRRVYLTLDAAEAAIGRARAQGRAARLQLLRCTPVGGGAA